MVQSRLHIEITQVRHWPADQIQHPGEGHLCSEYTSGSVSRTDQASFLMNLYQNNAHMSQEVWWPFSYENSPLEDPMYLASFMK